MEPILRDIPYSFESERLTIRGPLPGDGERLRTAVKESQEALKPWMPWAVSIPSKGDYETIVRKGQVRYLAREDLWMMLLLKGTDTIIGGSGLHRIKWSVARMEIGYWVHTAYRGKGFITEAVKAITQFAFSACEASRVEIRCDEKNVRSAAVARRAGFNHEGTLIAEDRHHLTNELRNTMIFAITRPD